MATESTERAVIDEMPELFEIYSYQVWKVEEKTMFLYEYDEEKVLAQERAEGYAEGYAEGFVEGFVEEYTKRYAVGRAEAIEFALQLLLDSGKICKQDVDDIRTKVDEKCLNAGIV